jgi:hypothetical protein
VMTSWRRKSLIMSCCITCFSCLKWVAEMNIQVSDLLILHLTALWGCNLSKLLYCWY